MKQTIPESPANLSRELVEPEPDKPAQASPKRRPAGVQKAQETQLPILVPDHSGFAGYAHWGLNE
jgi:hypothetical protein